MKNKINRQQRRRRQIWFLHVDDCNFLPVLKLRVLCRVYCILLSIIRLGYSTLLQIGLIRITGGNQWDGCIPVLGCQSLIVYQTSKLSTTDSEFGLYEILGGIQY